MERVEVPLYKSSRGVLFKTLLSSACRMDCLYCPYRRGGPAERHAYTPSRLARLAFEAVRRGLASGVFISSGLYGDPEVVTEAVVEAAERLRALGYRGYIHLRLMPGTPPSLVRRAAEVADRIGVNLETVDPSRFAEIAPSKGSWSLDLYSRLAYAARVAGDPRRVDTQLVVGAAGETDEEIIELTYRLLRLGVGVVHYSPYTPVPGTPLAEKRRATPEARARRLYEAEALMRDYRMTPEDLKAVLDDRGMLPLTPRSLKEEVAEAHPEWFPVDPEEATLEELLRVPGIGPKTARAVLEARREGRRIDRALLYRLLGGRARKALKYLDVR